MKTHLLLPLFLVLIAAGCYAQDNEKLMHEVSTKLNSGNSVSSILSNASYDALHPHTAFRELIKKHSKSGILVIANEKEAGKKIQVIGTIQDGDGKPVADALVYMYQTDARGWYAADAPHVNSNSGDFRQAQLFGYVKTDRNGKFELNTVKPSGYPNSELPAHIHVHVDAQGYDPFVNEFLFDDDERLTGSIRSSSVRNGFLIAKPEKANGSYDQKFSYIISLQRKQ